MPIQIEVYKTHCYFVQVYCFLTIFPLLNILHVCNIVISKIAKTYRTLVTYTNSACLFHEIKELFVAVSCIVSVLKGWSCSRQSCYKPCTKRD